VGLKINSIQIQKLGPLSSVQLDLGMINCIYGLNESGKTYLTEFMLHSIFRHAKTWNLRDINPEGSIHIDGLGGQSTAFSPSSPKKIEDYWAENNRGLPLNMARLLVVKGGELDFTESPGGVDRNVLKNALTSQELLDQIRDSIQPTVRNSQLINQTISGKNQGQINDLNNLKNNLRDIENLLGLIEKKYSRGPVKQIEDQLDLIQLQLEQQLRAKRHKAFLLSKKQNDLRKQREKISDDSYLSLRDRVRDHKKLKADLKNLSLKIKSSRTDIETYHWLKSAVNIWEEYELENKKVPQKVLMVIGGVLLTAGLLVTVLQNIYAWSYLFWTGIGIAAFGGLIIAYFGFQLLAGLKNPTDAGERDAIRTTYNEKFGQPLIGLTGLRAEQNNLQENYLKAKSYQEEYSKLEVRLTSEQEQIKASFLNLIGETIQEKDWESCLKTIKKQSTALDTEISDLAIQIAKLNLEEDKYLNDPQDIEYDPLIQADIENHLAGLSGELASLQSDLDTLKVRATEWTKDDISIPWIEVLHNLRSIQSDIKQSHIELTAEIVAKIGLSEILSRIEEEEDQKILENINSNEVTNLLNKMTGKYQSLNLIDDQVYVRDPYQEYPLRDLSTGAKEQVQLALRLGIASNVSGGEPLFVILDDAFQHTDWERRDSLVDEMVNLATQGWQVIYLTMDDHIRDLFIKKGREKLKNKFAFFDL